MIVVADTSALNYLVLIQRIDLLQRLYGHIYIPETVLLELSDAGAPPPVRAWVQNLPPWIESRTITNQDSSIDLLGRGEQDGIALAEAIGAELILLDDRAARKVAKRRNIGVTGTLGVLERALKLGLIDQVDLKDAIDKLRQTNFRATEHLISKLSLAGGFEAQNLE
jgi:predicted nucleic acid-binding protein